MTSGSGQDPEEERLRTPYDRVVEAFTEAFGTLRRGTGRGPALALLATGALLAFVVSGTTSLVIERTGRTEFCTGCHVYDDFGAAYRRTVHHENASGVRAECGDCHIPYGHWPDTLAVKAASGLSSLWAYTVGGVDTPAAFEARRPELVRAVWRQYRRRNSDFCANCHDPDAWATAAQSLAARAAHRAVEAGQAQCIDCHLGVAHALPDDLPAGLPASVHPEGPPQAAHADEAGPAATDGAAARRSEPPAEQRADGPDAADPFAPCAGCHGNFAPDAAALAALDPETFLDRLREHAPVDGAVARLDEAARRRLHASLRNR